MNVVCAVGVFLLLSGCLDPAKPIDDILPGDPMSWDLNFGEPVKIGPGGDAEVSLRISPDGETVLACAHGGFTRPSPLWASTDGGETFRYIDPQPNPIVSGDCDLVITENGDWYIVYDTIASATVAASSDKGATWRFHYVAAPPFGGVDRPWLESAGNTVYLTYADVMSAQPYIGTFTKSSDGGRTWSPPVVMGTFEAPNDINCFMGHPTVKTDGKTIHSAINCADGTGPTDANTIYLLSSDDAGASWAKVQVRTDPMDTIRVVTVSYAPDGGLWLTYPTRADPEGRDVFVIHSRDDGESWSEPLLVFEDLEVGFGWPWVDARSDGSATIVMMHRTPPTPDDDGSWWGVSAARVEADPETELVSATEVFERVEAPSVVFEFIMVRHDEEDRANVLYLLPGDGCRVSPPVTGTGSGRNAQCVFLAKEAG